MTPGLINSVIDAPERQTSRPCVQERLVLSGAVTANLHEAELRADASQSRTDRKVAELYDLLREAIEWAQDERAARLSLAKSLALSEGVYDQQCEKLHELEIIYGKLQQRHNVVLRRLEMYTHVMVYATPGVLRGVR